jgi:hypothetical protein
MASIAMRSARGLLPAARLGGARPQRMMARMMSVKASVGAQAGDWVSV